MKAYSLVLVFHIFSYTLAFNTKVLIKNIFTNPFIFTPKDDKINNYNKTDLYHTDSYKRSHTIKPN